MMKPSTVATIAIGLLLGVQPYATVGQTPVAGPAATHNYARWEKEISAFEEADKKAPPEKGGVLFIGSSTIRLWKTLAEDFQGKNVVNRGFGGSAIEDSTHFADRIIFPYEPKQIFLRAGGNDIHDGKTPKEVAADFAEFVHTVRAKLPKTEILYIGLAPTRARWSEVDKGRELNRLIRTMALDMPFVGYVDADEFTLGGPDGLPREELFVQDRLHFSPTGYQLFAARVRPFVK
ncbi:GDSL-type esterase/lipase family protein [Paludisphaera rhizosphaerae]|uniref:GDSL-type esterase/lipase family protein n=1 Tax=Paludisphaera rhizosphaerae TaxID=2711216 RepID=UPI0013EA30BB|nr:GDSL-type esterase/lipase family protein [Paludisphaera rhizosphaerae]